ncbi:MAG: transcription termination/antitermination protein NusA, partial [Clostridia bacterium]|nr:transcription termination/antitermination protein NusA [Clostridia bacterium]
MKKAVTKKESENMGAEIFAAVDILESTKGIPRSYMLEKIEAALVSAYKKESGAVNVRIALDGEKKTFRLYQQKTVVEVVEDEKEQISLEEARSISRRYNVGDVVEFELKTKAFGRLSAQAAKQVIIQGIREAEHSNIVREY